MSEPSIFDRITERLADKQAEPDETTAISPERWQDWSIHYRLPDQNEWADCQEKAQNRAARRAHQDMTPAEHAKSSLQLLAQCCIGLTFMGEELLEADGDPCTFASKGVRERLDVASATEAVDLIYRGGKKSAPDWNIRASVDELLTRAGVGNDALVDEPDPTRGR